ncbi:uncharacterized protein TM35_000024950 [Trypanosoma theileri]|uniref:Uncharacterized protein n=1 Tax=Trypanosoma theileri TaxID=67003 RepID=A0A1X0P9A1_9TRYP|nr:uncharacterized protein TM35_000024950 [Trypanosoma theileri]ORC93169.1 hypothetical protein TM35_000024950 [Trypanosoma theileri]
MYRESLLGVALASTLSELESVCSLSERQKEQLWDIFDQAMDRTLAEAPVTSQVRVVSPFPLSREGKNRTDTAGSSTAAGAGNNSNNNNMGENSGVVTSLSTAPKRMMFPAPAGMRDADLSAPLHCDVLDDGTTFPVYRAHDGVWTILLKDPTVEVRDGTGHAETIRLDYLKVNLKDVSLTDTAKTQTAGKKRRR